MFRRRVIREEHPETGKLHNQTIRYDGEWRGTIGGKTRILIKVGEEELVNTLVSIPLGKILHTRISISGIQTDTPIEVDKQPKGA